MKKKLLISKLYKQESSKVPIWIMRQAGRYLPEYKKMRSNFKDFIDFCLTPDAAAEVTLQPLKRFDLDAAIIFSDILIVPSALGIEVKFIESIGPILNAISTPKDLKKIQLTNYNVFNEVGKAIKLVKHNMNNEYGNSKTLIGFAGAPFTIAAYMIEGRSSKDFAKVYKFSHTYPKTFRKLINIITKATIEYLEIQIQSGVEVIKLFDSWAGLVPESKFESYVIKPIEIITKTLKKKFPEIPIIVFARNVGSKLKKFNKIQTFDAYAIDQYTDLSWCYSNLKNFDSNPVLQGNLDNFLLAYGNFTQIKNQVERIMRKAQSKHLVFNLGHGILPYTPIKNVEYLINIVKAYK